MKKFLSLMLAMIMAMSLVTVGAGAAFSDAEEIQYKEAVQVMADLGILAGYDDGSFKPQGNLSRGAAAKIIAYIALGTTTAESLSLGDMKFTDVPATSSRAPFIAWASEQGIVDGYGDGTFNPNGNVSGHAFLKMVLGAMGIDGVFTGTSWRVNVVSAAEENDLFTGIDTDTVTLSEDCTRELACQIAFNAMFKELEAKTVYKVGVMEFTESTDAAIYASLTGGEVTYTKREAGSMAERNFKVATAEGMVISNAAVNADQEYAEKTKVGSKYYAFASDLSLIGHNVTVYYNSKTDKVISVYDNSRILSVSTSKNTVEAVNAELSKDLEDELDEAAEIEFDVPYWDATYTKDTITSTTVFGDKADAESADAYAESYAKSSYNLIITDGKITAVTKSLSKTLAKVVEIEADEDNDGEDAYITLTGDLELENNTTTDEVVEYADIAEDDYVVYTKAGDVYTLTKAGTVTGKITKINDTKVTLGGKTYSKTGTDKTGDALENKFTASTVNFTDEYTLYLSGSSYLAIAAAEVSSDVVFFVAGYELKADSSSSYGEEDEDVTYWAQCVDLNGNEVKYQLAGAANMKQGLYKVSTAYDKTVKATVATFNSADANTTTRAIDEDDLKIAANHYYADDVKFISVVGTKSDLEVTVKKGVQNVDAVYGVGEDALVKYYIASGDGTNKTVSYVFVAGEFSEGNKKATGDIVYAIEGGLDLIDEYDVISVPYVDEDDNDQIGYEHTVYIDGVKTTIITDSAAALEGFVELTEIVDGVYSTEIYGEGADEVANLIVSGKVTNVYNGMITVEDWDNAAAEDEDITLIDVAADEAEIIDLRLELEVIEKEKDKVTKLSKLEGRTVALVLDDTTFEVFMIYVIG